MMFDSYFFKESFLAGKRVYTHHGISYQKLKHHKWKYLLNTPYSFPAKLGNLETDYIKIDNCQVTIKANYCWDGASGPCFDTRRILRGSLVHDSLYQLIREGHLERKLRKYADSKFYIEMRDCGVGKIRAKYCYYAVRLFGWIFL